MFVLIVHNPRPAYDPPTECLCLAETTPPRPWLETHDQYNQRLKTCCEAINRDLDVSGLCRGWMKRMQDLKDKAGDRLHH